MMTRNRAKQNTLNSQVSQSQQLPLVEDKPTAVRDKYLSEKKESSYSKDKTPILGEGSFGTVRRVGNDIVVKSCDLLTKDGDIYSDNLKEINIYKLYGNNDNFTKLIDVGVSSDYTKLEMRFEYGGTPINMICNDFFLRHWKKIVYDLVKQLDFLHYHNIIVNDIKPSNILVNRNADARIIDFGAVSMCSKLDFWKGGTEDFRACELENNIFKPSNDIYSLGLCLLYKITNKRYSQDEINKLRVRVPSKDIDKDLLYIIRRCLDYDYNTRITARELEKLSVFKDIRTKKEFEYISNTTKVSDTFINKYYHLFVEKLKEYKRKTEKLILLPYAIDLLYRFSEKRKKPLGDEAREYFNICFELVHSFCSCNNYEVDEDFSKKERLKVYKKIFEICNAVNYVILFPLIQLTCWDKYTNKKVGDVIYYNYKKGIITTLDMITDIVNNLSSFNIYDKELDSDYESSGEDSEEEDEDEEEEEEDDEE